MDSTDLAFAGAVRQAELIRSGELSSRELVELTLRRIERIDPLLNAFRTVMAERALAEADQADRRRAAGEDRPLLGLPVGIKDNVDVAGELTTDGTAAHGPPATADAELVRLLRAAGAVVVGKTNLPELAAIGATESLSYGVTRNPWDLDRTPGGSSGGAGAAVAAGLVALGQASDGAGSIRIPASCCGLFGLKPTRGRVSLAPNEGAWFGLATAGVLTRSVAETALFLDATARKGSGTIRAEAAWPRDSLPARMVPDPFRAAAASEPEPLRIAVSTALPVPQLGLRVAPPVLGALENTAALLGELGHHVEEHNPDYGHIPEVFLASFLRGISDAGRAMPRPDRLQRRTRQMVRMGGLLPRAAAERVVAARDEQSARVARSLEGHDVLLTPVATRQPVGAAKWEGRHALPMLLEMARVYPYTGAWNATGQPAASVPAGFDADGMPLAIQLVGRHGQERTLLALAAQLEAARPWAERRPALAGV